MNCASCHAPVVSHYAVTRVTVSGAPQATIAMCSLVCLIRWAYNETALQGIALASQARGAFDQLMSMLKGSGGAR